MINDEYELKLWNSIWDDCSRQGGKHVLILLCGGKRYSYRESSECFIKNLFSYFLINFLSTVNSWSCFAIPWLFFSFETSWFVRYIISSHCCMPSKARIYWKSKEWIRASEGIQQEMWDDYISEKISLFRRGGKKIKRLEKKIQKFTATKLKKVILICTRSKQLWICFMCFTDTLKRSWIQRSFFVVNCMVWKSRRDVLVVYKIVLLLF